MTVAELIEKLKEFEQHYPCVLESDNGLICNNITNIFFEEHWMDGDCSQVVITAVEPKPSVS